MELIPLVIKKQALHSILLWCSLMFLLSIDVQAQFYNGTRMSFGKNRVQFDNFEWKYYRFSNLETYFYKGGNELAIYTAKIASAAISRQQQLFEYKLRDKIQFIIYNKQSHFKQSNVGLSLENGELGGVNEIMGSKVFIYFNGDHADFSRQIKQGVAQILINQQVYGSSWRQVVKNASLLNLPLWFTRGLSSYLSTDWNPAIENKVRDAIIYGRYERFNRLSDADAVVAGHSMWNYIVETYGEAVMPNLLYMTRVTQNVEKGFVYVLGVTLSKFMEDWLAYYRESYSSLKPTPKDWYKEVQQIKTRKRKSYKQFKMSPNDSAYAYVTDQLGQYKIYIHYLPEDKRYKIYKREYKLDRVNDNSYPVLAWHPSGNILTFVTEEKGLLLIHYFDVVTGLTTVKQVYNLEKILDMAYAPDGKEMIFSGVYKGQSDLYLYNVGANAQKKITDDSFDDLSPQFMDENKVVFTSNRIVDSLGYAPNDAELSFNQKDVWIVDFSAEPKQLHRVTNTSESSEIQPYVVDTSIFYLAQEEAIYKRMGVVKDSFITHIDTVIHYHHFYEPLSGVQSNFKGIEEHHMDDRGNFTEIVVDDYRYRLLSSERQEKEQLFSLTSGNNVGVAKDTTTYVPANRIHAVLLKKVVVPENAVQQKEIDIQQYAFENESVQRQVTRIEKPKVLEATSKKLPVKPFVLPNQRNYNLSFFNDNSSLKLTNTFVNGQYQVFTGGPFIAPGIGPIIKLGTIDLLEDYKVSGGIRMASSSTEYFLTYQDFKYRRDKEYTFSRNVIDSDQLKLITNKADYSLKQPFSEVASLRGTLTLRNDKTIFKTSDISTLNIKNQNEYRAALKMAYVFDNSRPQTMNIYYGSKLKIFGEHYQQFLSESGGNGNMQVLGIDFRHSQEISREIVWVNRFAASGSFGSEKLIYYLGSVDDWMPSLFGQQRFINADDIDLTIPYRYQALAANLRGFAQNIRRGTNFTVINSELRFPVFQYFISRPIRSPFVRHFQTVGFFDMGMAWNGVNPYSDDNITDRNTIVDGPVTVVTFQKVDPIVAGYGFGFRTMLLGYFLRLDWAWGIEDKVSRDRPMFYLSLNLDI